MANPGKRAPTVEICNSDKPYEPLAIREHVLGPVPFDPNLVSQGILPDSRAEPDEHTFAPLEGTPLPPGAVPSGTPPGPPAPGSVNQPPTAPPPDAGSAAVPATPSSFPGGLASQSASVAVGNYDPRTGRYIGGDGRVYEQSDLKQAAEPSQWQDLLPH
jgi:hypothetical protein